VPKSTAIKIAGGKVYQAARIVSLIPPHETFLEPYFGGGSVLLNKPCEGINEIVCDIDGHLMNFWNVLRDKKQFAEFRRMCQATPFSEQLWKDQDDEALGKGTAVDRAWAFFVRCRQSRSGDRESFATVSTGRRRRGMNEQVSAWLSAIDGLEEIHARLQRVLMLTEDGVRLLKKYDGKKVFAFMDPPYPSDTRTKNLYQFEMSDAQHEELLLTLGRFRGKFLLSTYPNPLYEAAAKKYKWTFRDLVIDNKLSGKREKEKKIERVYANFAIPAT